MSALDRHPDDPPYSPVAAGARAAAMLAEACGRSLRSHDPADRAASAHLGVVRDLALDLERQLGALAGMAKDGEDTTDTLVEAALACADLATLAACNLPEIQPGEARGARTAVRLATDAVRGLSGRIEAEAAGLEASRAEYVLRDARSAAWRADLAARQEAARSRGTKPG